MTNTALPLSDGEEYGKSMYQQDMKIKGRLFI